MTSRGMISKSSILKYDKFVFFLSYFTVQTVLEIIAPNEKVWKGGWMGLGEGDNTCLK